MTVYLFVHFSICYQDYIITTGWIFMKNNPENMSWSYLDHIKF